LYFFLLGLGILYNSLYPTLFLTPVQEKLLEATGMIAMRIHQGIDFVLNSFRKGLKTKDSWRQTLALQRSWQPLTILCKKISYCGKLQTLFPHWGRENLSQPGF